MTVPSEFLTPDRLGQLPIAAIAVAVVSRAAHCVLGSNALFIAVLMSLVVAYVLAGVGGTLQSVHRKDFPTPAFFKPVLGWFLPLVNGCLLFTTVIGIENVVYVIS